LLLPLGFAGHCSPVLRLLVAKKLWGQLIQKFFSVDTGLVAVCVRCVGADVGADGGHIFGILFRYSF
jgi:hypothetical protein